MEPHREQVVNEWTILCPEGMILTPLLSVASIQWGRSPVRNTPENEVVPKGGVVTKGMNVRSIRFCSARTVFSVSPNRLTSKARDATLTNLTLRDDALEAGMSNGEGEDTISYTTS